MFKFSDTKDDYGKEAVPLTLHRLLEGRSLIPETKLLSLPVEVLAIVVAAIPSESLNNIAQVNPAWRQIACSLQFPSLCLDYSERSWEIVQKLSRESFARADPANDRRTNRLALGPYIRRLTIATSNEWLFRYYGVKRDEVFGALPQAQMSIQLQRARQDYFWVYLPTIKHILNNQITLPNLQLLDIRDAAPFHPTLLDVFTNSTLKHLKMSCVRFNPLRAIRPAQSYPQGSWPLQSLHLEIKPVERDRRLDLSRLSLSLLLHCSSKLKLLTWVGHRYGEIPISTNHLERIPSFQSLRHLRLRALRFADTGLLQKLVHDNLVSLDVSPSLNRDFFNSCGQILKLQLFVCDTPSTWIANSITFLQNNNHVSKLAISDPLRAFVIEAHILPLLGRSFSQLRSLSMIWDQEEYDISEHALDLISRISSLEQLHLSVGTPEGWVSEWDIDSEKMRHYLSRLPRLKKLAFTADEYRPDGFEIDHETDEGVDDDHRRRALDEADLYLEVMPQLEWLFIGQIPWAVEEDSDGVRELVEIPRLHIGDYWTVLNEMFGWRGMSVWKSA